MVKDGVMAVARAPSYTSLDFIVFVIVLVIKRIGGIYMNDFLMRHFDTVEEREAFLRWYSFEGYSAWLFANGYTSTLDNLKTYKNWCYNYVMERVWVI